MPDATDLAARVLALRGRGVSRQRIGEVAGLGTGSKIVRIEGGSVYAHEVARLDEALRRLESEYGIARHVDVVSGERTVDRHDQRSTRYDDAAGLVAATKVGMRCRDCGIWWSGATTAHCPTCHYTFTTPTIFDIHRVGEPTRRTCRHPGDLTDHDLPLRQVERGGALAWAYPVTEGATDRLNAMRTGTYVPVDD